MFAGPWDTIYQIGMAAGMFVLLMVLWRRLRDQNRH
jgi:hypothetical protein